MSDVIIVPPSQPIVEITPKTPTVLQAAPSGLPGPKGDPGPLPVKGVDYFDGRNPLTVSATPPTSPAVGDLWYKP